MTFGKLLPHFLPSFVAISDSLCSNINTRSFNICLCLSFSGFLYFLYFNFALLCYRLVFVLKLLECQRISFINFAPSLLQLKNLVFVILNFDCSAQNLFCDQIQQPLFVRFCAFDTISELCPECCQCFDFLIHFLQDLQQFFLTNIFWSFTEGCLRCRSVRGYRGFPGCCVAITFGVSLFRSTYVNVDIVDLIRGLFCQLVRLLSHRFTKLPDASKTTKPPKPVPRILFVFIRHGRNVMVFTMYSLKIFELII
mmetsp:Transcript_21062/g.31215  ORF Transcript_21062/g.31215 Transcript_21062/m.31215 type:complete len:253 (+) Transcript_21062:8436-9194(+)